MRIDYSDKRFLIVDNLKPSRDVLKQLANSLDPDIVDTAQSANEALKRCSNLSYDVLLLGYDLGEKQKNGQQLLEELKVTKLIGRQTVVILVTAEMSQAMVLAALEHKPDDYLVKPYTTKELAKRLDRCFQKKIDMEHIYQSLDRGEKDKTIKLCDQALANNTPYQSECMGIMSRQYFEMGELDQAISIYKAYQDVKNCQWATIGLGKIAMQQDDIATAIDYFTQIKDKYPLYLKAYDLLATAQQTMQKREEAEQTLSDAVSLCPLAVKRMLRYAHLCSDNNNLEKATWAFEQNYLLSHNSIHHRPSNALYFAESVTEYASQISEQRLRQLKNRVMDALHETVRSFREAPVRIQAQLLTADLMLKTNASYDAKRLMDSTDKLLAANQQELSVEDELKIAKLLIRVNKEDAANLIINNVVAKSHDELPVMTEVDKLIDINSIEHKHEAQLALDRALQYYYEKKYRLSIQSLEKAHNLYPQHIGILLNLIQVLLTEYQELKTSKETLSQAGSFLNKANQLPINRSAKQRLKSLEAKYQQLIQ